MASKEDNVSEIISGRRTRSSNKTSAPLVAASGPRATRRSSKRQVHEQKQIEDEDEKHKFDGEEMQSSLDAYNASDQIQNELIKEMFEEAAQGPINDHDDECEIIYEERVTVSEEILEMPDDCIVYEEQEGGDGEQAVGVDEEQQQLEEDVDMYAAQEDERIIRDVPVVSETGLEEKSSSFPFGNVVSGQSETSEDAQNEEANNETGAVESSLLASLAGDNANSLPSVGGGEETEGKKEDFEAKVGSVPTKSEKMESDNSSEPAIAEDIAAAEDTSNATIVNTEVISEDELPPPTKPEINDAEEVSDDELPAPQRAELPADAEVISEDELPAASTVEKKSTTTSPKNTSKNISFSSRESNGQKRKADDVEKDELKSDKHKSDSTKRRNEEQYNPMSPTSESNDATPTPPVEKKSKTDSGSNESEHKERKKDKDKEREKEKEKEKERKRLPDLDKYWRAVKEDPSDFTGWTYLLQYVDNETDADAAREAYDAFLSHYPYCYGYWRKYADYEKRKGVKANCNAVFERGLEAIPLSVDLWLHYLAHVKSNHTDDEPYIRSQFERAIKACGLEFRSDKLWDAYIKWESEGKRYQQIFQIYDRLLSIPTQGYSAHFDNFQDLINTHPITSLINAEELRLIRTELRESTGLRSSSSRSKTRSNDSKEKEKERKDEPESGSKSPNEKESESTDEAKSNTNHEEIDSDDADIAAEKKSDDDLTDMSTLTDEEISAIKDKVISIRRKIHKTTVAAVTARWSFEEGIKRPYFHVKPLERCQLKNWKDYLDFEIEKGDRTRILVLFERCLIACALYDEFWLKMIRYLETESDQPGIPEITSDVYRRACEIHHPDKPSLHLMWAAFEECQKNFDRAAAVLENLEKKCPNLLQVAYRRINVERRRGDLNKCRELYDQYINTVKNKTIAGSLSIKYARFLNKICNDLESGLRVLQEALEKDPANVRIALQMVDLVLQRPIVDENEVVLIMDKFMARENMDPEQKVLFAQRKVEFLEDFGSTAKGLQDAQRALQLALSKANEAKKKRESSPSRKTLSNKDNSPNLNSSAQSTYNNASNAPPTNYGYNSTNPAYYGQQNSGAYPQQSYDGYYNHWQYGSNYSGYSQWSGYGNYY